MVEKDHLSIRIRIEKKFFFETEMVEKDHLSIRIEKFFFQN